MPLCRAREGGIYALSPALVAPPLAAAHGRPRGIRCQVHASSDERRAPNTSSLGDRRRFSPGDRLPNNDWF
jgi:hypothetical protein